MLIEEDKDASLANCDGTNDCISPDTRVWVETSHVHSRRLNIHLLQSTIFGNTGARCNFPSVDWLIRFNHFSTFQIECSPTYEFLILRDKTKISDKAPFLFAACPICPSGDLLGASLVFAHLNFSQLVSVVWTLTTALVCTMAKINLETWRTEKLAGTRAQSYQKGGGGFKE